MGNFGSHFVYRNYAPNIPPHNLTAGNYRDTVIVELLF